MKKKNKKTSLADIGRRAGVSTFSVSCALKNKPGVGAATRARILRAAKEMGYAPNARLISLMAEVRKTSSQDLLPIAWLNTAYEKDAWHRYRFHTPYLEGAHARALDLGYKIEEIWTHEPGMTMRRLAKILYQRGIEGVIITFPVRNFRLNWDHLAAVALGASLLAPRLHRVTADLNFNLQLALKSLKRLGYERIGICLAWQVDSASQHSIRATARDLYFSASSRKRVPPLLYPPNAPVAQNRADVIAWMKRHRPGVIVVHDPIVKKWVEEAGFRVPRDVGFVNLAVDNDVLDWAGIRSRRRETGATAIDQLVSLMRSHQFGVPKTPLDILIRGTWQTGRTLREPEELRGNLRKG
jgi:DNA-binding LacI/PurR family transcriptional regulator